MYSARGFTLIELLVVISIISIMSVVAFVNFKDFTQDQILNKAVGQVQTYLRLAQANATAGVVCNNLGGADWRINLKPSRTEVDLECSTDNFQNTQTVKTLTLENIRVDSVKGSACTSSSSPPLYITYAKLSGSIKIIGNDPTGCINLSSTVLVNLKRTIGEVCSGLNSPNSCFKNFTISKGGAIDAQ